MILSENLEVRRGNLILNLRIVHVNLLLNDQGMKSFRGRLSEFRRSIKYDMILMMMVQPNANDELMQQKKQNLLKVQDGRSH